MIRFFDVILSGIILFFAWPFLLVFYIIGLLDTGKPIFIQKRVGLNLNTFKLLKFRTMALGTASVATHEVNASSVTYIGRVLRKSKMDELPQLLNVIRGDMCLVGPRPCLPEQQDVINARIARGVFSVKPGITGLSQIKEIDMSTPQLLAKTDSEMIEALNLKTYFRLLFLTALGKGKGDRVKQKK